MVNNLPVILRVHNWNWLGNLKIHGDEVLIMVELFYTIYMMTRVTGIFLGLILGFIILRKYLKYRINIILLLLGPAIGFIGVSFFGLLPNIVQNEAIIDLSTIIVSIFSATFFSSILIFLTYFSNRNSTIRLSVISSLLMAVIALQIVAFSTSQPELVGTMYNYQNTLVPDWSGLVSIFLLPLVVVTTIWGYLDISRSLKNALNVKHKNQIMLMRYGFVSIFFMAIFLNILVNLLSGLLPLTARDLNLWLIQIVLLGFFAPIGIALISASYLMSNEIAFLQPTKIDQLLVIHKIGIPLYQFDFNPAQSTDPNLLSGAIKAITAIMEEALGVSTDINNIQFKSKELLLEFQEDVAFILITEKETGYLRSGLRRFKQQFISTYEQELTEFETDITPFNSADLIIKDAFGL